MTTKESGATAHVWAYSPRLGGEICSGCGAVKSSRTMGTNCPHKPETRPMQISAAMYDVVKERERQIALGWTRHHDDEHVNDEIAAFACFYLMPPAARDWDASSTTYGATLGEAILPEGFEGCPGPTRRGDLVKAAALAIAEIERIDRADAIKAVKASQAPKDGAA